MDLRIPFNDAINDERLFKHRFFGPQNHPEEGLSLAQQVMLKTIYGVPLVSGEEKVLFAAQQGYATYDDLGYIIESEKVPYKPRKYKEAWIIAGRRAGKSDAIAATAVAYEACFGGHEQHLRRGQKGYIYQIAQDMRMAMYALHFIYAAIEGSRAAREMLDGPPIANEIRLKNNIVVKVLPPTLKSVRGFACPVAVLDEVGVWYQESDSANPDYEIYNAVTKAQIQFPNKLLIGISSPYNKQGLLYRNYEGGTMGKNLPADRKMTMRNTVVIHAPTAAVGNPRVTRESLEDDRDLDAKAYERECLAIFQDSLSGFLSSTLINNSVEKGVEELEYNPTYTYVAAIDPAFRHDAFAFTIFHIDEEGNVVQDVIRRYKPEHGNVNNPDAIFSDIGPICQSYNIANVYSDQYHLESLQQLAFKHGLLIEGVPFKATNKAQIFGSLQQLLNQGRMRLLDNAECLKELRQLERRLTQGGVVQISAPPGLHDDLAAVTAICSYKCLWLLPKPKEAPEKEKSTHERILEQIRRKRTNNLESWD